jgi:hypothetical protein
LRNVARNRYFETIVLKQLTHNPILHFIIIYEQNPVGRHTAFLENQLSFSSAAHSRDFKAV